MFCFLTFQQEKGTFSKIFQESCSFFFLCATYYQTGQLNEKMNDSERKFEEMVREHRGTIYAVCYMFSNDQDEVADLFQEVLINLWKGLASFKGESDIKTWIYRVSLNTCISFERKKKHEVLPLEMDVNLYDDRDDDTRQIKMLYHRINRLGVFDRAIVLLWLENLSYDEIASIVGISVKNVSVRLVRIKEQLKNMSND